MFTGMSTRVAQELGLHRKNPSIYTSIGRSPINDATSNLSDAATPLQPHTSVGLQEFESSSQIILWWCPNSPRKAATGLGTSISPQPQRRTSSPIVQ